MLNLNLEQYTCQKFDEEKLEFHFYYNILNDFHISENCLRMGLGFC